MKLINRIILQWLFIRLTKCTDSNTRKYWYSLQFWIIPLSGYILNSNLKYINDPIFLRITKRFSLKL